MKTKQTDIKLVDFQKGGYGTFTVNGVTSPISPEPKYKLVPENAVIKKGDKVYDYYAGWMISDGVDAKFKCHARVIGRWLAWERKIKK